MSLKLNFASTLPGGDTRPSDIYLFTMVGCGACESLKNSKNAEGKDMIAQLETLARMGGHNFTHVIKSGQNGWNPAQVDGKPAESLKETGYVPELVLVDYSPTPFKASWQGPDKVGKLIEFLMVQLRDGK